MSKGPIASGTLGDMTFNTVFGKVNAQVEFLHSGADGIPLAQAFRFLDMDETSSRRFSKAAQQMQAAGFSDAEATTVAPDTATRSPNPSPGSVLDAFR